MNTKFSRIFTMMTAIVMACAILMSMTACNNSAGTESTPTDSSEATTAATYPTAIFDKDGNPVQMPTDNDVDGWFSAEVLAEYSASGFALPKGTEVSSKPERTTLYLSGGDKAFKTTVLYAYDAIRPANDAVYLPVLTLDENGVAEVSSLDRISSVNTDNLAPEGDETNVTLIYKSARRVLECSISLVVTNGKSQVEVSFADRTKQYGDLV